MNAILRLLVLLPGVLFLVMGLRWLLAPRGIAPEFGTHASEWCRSEFTDRRYGRVFSATGHLYSYCAGDSASILVLPTNDPAVIDSAESSTGLAHTRCGPADKSYYAGDCRCADAVGCFSSFTPKVLSYGETMRTLCLALMSNLLIASATGIKCVNCPNHRSGSRSARKK